MAESNSPKPVFEFVSAAVEKGEKDFFSLMTRHLALATIGRASLGMRGETISLTEAGKVELLDKLMEFAAHSETGLPQQRVMFVRIAFCADDAVLEEAGEGLECYIQYENNYRSIILPSEQVPLMEVYSDLMASAPEEFRTGEAGALTLEQFRQAIVGSRVFLLFQPIEEIEAWQKK